MGTPSRLWFRCGGSVRRPGTDSAIGSFTARGEDSRAETQRDTIRVVTTESPLWAIAQNALSAFLLSSQRLCVSARERLSHDSGSEPRGNRSQVSALARGLPPAECCIEASRSVNGNDSTTTGSGYPLKTRKRRKSRWLINRRKNVLSVENDVRNRAISLDLRLSGGTY